ncbi:MAG: YbaK/EbsC family protein [Clostridiales bacterium]|mgnify:CR=1 FL=1|nr:YbaK/EbsC family protein [Clostridiales bacterium]
MSFAKAKEHLMQYGLDSRIMEFSVSSATVKEAANAIGCEEEEIAKTLSFLMNDQPVCIVAAGNCKIDNSKFKAEFHVKAKMIPFDSVEMLIGHAAGGVCPFAVNENVTIYLDISLKKFKTIYPACGSSNSAVKLTVDELELASDYVKWVDVCKNMQ